MFTMNGIDVMARREEWSMGVSLFLRQKQGKGWASANPIVMAPHEQGERIDPMVTIDMRAAQQLMDELWQCGLRPSEGTGSAGSLAATERHLKDMQTIALGLLHKSGQM